MSAPVIVIGAGGHAAVVADALMARGIDILGFTEANSDRHGGSLLGRPILGEDDLVLSQHSPDRVLLANGIGSVGSADARRSAQVRLQKAGWRFTMVQHPSSIVSAKAQIGPGVQMMAGSIIQVGAKIEEGSIVNTGAIVEHDCEIGSFVHIAPRAVLCGNVSIGPESHVGAGATVKQGLRLGPRTLIGAGAVVLKDFGRHGVLVGNPARPMGSKA